MRFVLGIAFALATGGCATDLEPAPCTPPLPRGSVAAPAAAVGDDFDEAFVQDQPIAPTEPARSRSLGYIGDQPIGVLPTPPHHEPDWTRPFPCHWTGTCFMAPVPQYIPPSWQIYPGD